MPFDRRMDVARPTVWISEEKAARARLAVEEIGDAAEHFVRVDHDEIEIRMTLLFVAHRGLQLVAEVSDRDRVTEVGVVRRLRREDDHGKVPSKPAGAEGGT